MAEWLNKLRRNVKAGSGTFFAARITEYATRSLPENALLMVANFVGPRFLKDPDAHKDTARAFGAFFGDQSEVAASAWIEFWEELGKISREADRNPDDFEDIWERSKFGRKEDDMADKKEAKKDDKPAAPAVPPKPPELTLMQVVGGLDVTQQQAFWAAVIAHLATLADESDKDNFRARLNRVTMPKESVTAILAAPDSERPKMLQQAVMQAFNAGGAAGGFRHIMDATANALSGALGGDQLDPDGFRKGLETGNAALVARNKRMSKLR